MRDLVNTPVTWMSVDELQAAWVVLQNELTSQDGITLPQAERRDHIQRRLSELGITSAKARSSVGSGRCARDAREDEVR